MAITASIIGATFITVMMDGTTHTISGDHANYGAIREALKSKDHDLVERLINVKAAVTRFAKGQVRVEADKVFYGDMEVKGSVVNRILQMVREGFDAQPMLNFLANLMQNPSKRAVDELYGFLEATNLPITEDGCFLAYKKVRDDWKDFYTGTITHKMAHLMTAAELAELPKTFGNVTVSVENGVTVLSMPRNQVDDNKDQTCSYGLHFCSLSYLPHYHGGDGRVLIVKINPADVVSIPSDYNNAKGRAACYAIVEERADDTRESKDYFTAPVYATSSGSAVPASPPARSSTAPSAALSGYNKGRSDAANGRAYDDRDARFAGTDAQRFAEAYRKGFDSMSKPVPVTVAESEDQAFDRGYDAGQKQAEADSEALRAYNSQPPAGEGRHFNEGYETGYEDNYYVDWEDAGRSRAEQDVDMDRPYNDTPPEACDDESIYREGYANGWRDAKIARI